MIAPEALTLVIINTYTQTYMFYLFGAFYNKERKLWSPPAPLPLSPLPPFFTTKWTNNELTLYGLFICWKFRFVLIFRCKTANVVRL